MNLNLLQVVSLLFGLCAYLFLLIFSIASWIRGVTGRALFGAVVATTAFLIALGFSAEARLVYSLDFLSLFGWIVLALRAIGLDAETIRSPKITGVTSLALISTLAVLVGVGLSFALPDLFTHGDSLQPLFITKILLSVCGLVVLEQLSRNTRVDLRWKIRYLNLGLSIIFSFSLLHGAVCLLFGTQIGLLTILQPSILALAVPLITIGSLRNRGNELKLNLSRQFVFRSGVLVITGAILILMALVGYYLQATENDVGVASVLLLTTVSLVALVLVVGSTTFQIRARRLISRHLYENTYDYRAYWARVTEQLTEPNPDFSLNQQAIRSVLGIFDATGGAYWRHVGNQFVHISSFHSDWAGPLSLDTSSEIANLLRESDRTVDLQEPQGSLNPKSLSELHALSELRFLVPLFVHRDLIGMIGIKNPPVNVMLSDDDHELVKLVSRQAAGFLALRIADERLSESQQFDTMNRLSTFFIHDLKTISAQLTLLLENAERYKTNPQFIEDMLSTVGHANSRMDKLLKQIVENRDNPIECAKIGAIIPTVVDQFSCFQPRPQLGDYNPDIRVSVNRDKLAAALEHTLQNAIHATAPDGSIHVELLEHRPWLDINVVDTGTGMDEEFVENQLFSPFKSTKGVSGMGIGAYQTREHLRAMGGDVLINSEPGRGTCITLRVPLA